MIDCSPQPSLMNTKLIGTKINTNLKNSYEKVKCKFSLKFSKMQREKFNLKKFEDSTRLYFWKYAGTNIKSKKGDF